MGLMECFVLDGNVLARSREWNDKKRFPERRDLMSIISVLVMTLHLREKAVGISV